MDYKYSQNNVALFLFFFFFKKKLFISNSYENFNLFNIYSVELGSSHSWNPNKKSGIKEMGSFQRNYSKRAHLDMLCVTSVFLNAWTTTQSTKYFKINLILPIIFTMDWWKMRESHSWWFEACSGWKEPTFFTIYIKFFYTRWESWDV